MITPATVILGETRELRGRASVIDAGANKLRCSPAQRWRFPPQLIGGERDLADRAALSKCRSASVDWLGLAVANANGCCVVRVGEMRPGSVCCVSSSRSGSRGHRELCSQAARVENDSARLAGHFPQPVPPALPGFSQGLSITGNPT